METAPTNGESDLDVGTCLTLDQGARGRLYTIEAEIREVITQLGNAREKYLENEKKLLAEIAQRRQRYSSEAYSSGRAMGVEINPRSPQKWDFNSDEMTFTRVK